MSYSRRCWDLYYAGLKDIRKQNERGGEFLLELNSTSVRVIVSFLLFEYKEVK